MCDGAQYATKTNKTLLWVPWWILFTSLYPPTCFSRCFGFHPGCCHRFFEELEASTLHSLSEWRLTTCGAPPLPSLSLSLFSSLPILTIWPGPLCSMRECTDVRSKYSHARVQKEKSFYLCHTMHHHHHHHFVLVSSIKEELLTIHWIVFCSWKSETDCSPTRAECSEHLLGSAIIVSTPATVWSLVYNWHLMTTSLGVHAAIMALSTRMEGGGGAHIMSQDRYVCYKRLGVKT